MQENQTTGRSVYFMLMLPALLILVLTIGAGTYYGVTSQGDAETIQQGITKALPYLLLGNYLVLFAILLWVMQRDGLTLRQIWFGTSSSVGREIAIGLGVAIPLTLLNQFILLPVTEYLQLTFGDYVPPGEVAAAFRQNFIFTFILAGFIAPFVEESIYRGYAINRLGRRFSQTTTLIIVTLFFGILHWSQGFWPMLYTMLAGGIYAGFALWRRNLIGATITHSSFNIVEMLSWLR